MNTFTTIFKKTREKRDGLAFLRVLTVIMALGAVVLLSSCCDDLFPAEEPGKEETGTKPDGGGDTLLRRRTVMDSIDCLLKSGKKIGIPDYLSAIGTIIAAIAAIWQLRRARKSADRLSNNLYFGMAQHLPPQSEGTKGGTMGTSPWSVKTNMNERQLEEEDRELRRAFSNCKQAVLDLRKKYPDGLSDQEIRQKLSPKHGEDTVSFVLEVLRMEGVIVLSPVRNKNAEPPASPSERFPNWRWTDD